MGGEAEVVGRRFHACCRGACRSPRSPRPCDRAPAQDRCGEMACGRARRRSYSLAARSSTRSHAAHGRHDGTDAHSRRSQLRQSSSARRQKTRSKKVSHDPGSAADGAIRSAACRTPFRTPVQRVEQTRSAYLQTGCPFTTAMVLPWRVSLRLRLNDLGRRRRRGRRRDVRRPALPDQGRGPSW